ncbi:MAG: bacteriophage abortive infection AbiH family protein [Lachnospiraceae bacterium]|nr:bacteriophage abortive infection AbiH family protein [Lachnospiraceae bacterium]
MNILLIGNGFDLAHGLPTKYTDFLDFVFVIKQLINAKKSNDELSKLNIDSSFKKLNINIQSRIRYHFETKTFADNYIELWHKVIFNNIWIEYFLGNSNKLKENWIDFEKEIYFVISKLEQEIKEAPFSVYSTLCESNVECDNSTRNLNIIPRTYKNKLGKVAEHMEYNLDLFVKELENDLERLIFALELYISDFVNEIKPKKYSLDIKDLPINKVISFNYSSTFENVYKKNNNDNNQVIYDYIHGQANKHSDYEENNLVLGINEYLPDNEKNKNIRFIRFKKFFQRIHKETSSHYINWLERTKTHPYAKHYLYIFGHSLDDTDGDILRSLILNDDIITTIFYHNREAYAQQIANLVKVIGQDELIKRTGGSNKTIIFKKQSEMIEITSNK